MDNETNDSHIVIMSFYITGLSIARSLGRRGIKVVGVSSADFPKTYSRFVTHIREPQIGSEKERLEFFINIGRKFKSPAVLLPLLDADVMFLSSNRDILKEYFLFFLAPHEILAALTSKLDLIELADRHKIPLPLSILINNEADLAKIPSGFFPCVLKPDSQYSWRTEKAHKIGIGGLKAIFIPNKTELVIKYNQLKEVGAKLIVQKMIVGPDENHLDYHAFVDSNDRIIGEFVGKKFRLTPPHFGMGCYVESVKSEIVVNEGRRILRFLNYKGMANVNFKIDERDGRLYFFELNPRMSFWIGLDIACGVDFPYYYYKTCLEERIIPKGGYPAGKKWLSLYHDIRAIRPLIKDGSITWHRWIVSVIKADIGAIYDRGDPLPGIIFPFRIIKKMVRKVISKK